MTLDQRYQETLDYIYTYINNSLTHQADLSLEDADLSRMEALMAALNNPHERYPSIHVAGSKGKGSVSALCASALQEEGYKVGLYTSPHLRDYEERIQINRQPIPRAVFVDLVDELKPYIDAVPGLNTFEISTALALLYFAREAVDIAVIEVGLGGRLDATNVIMPRVAVITALYLEHTYILGNRIQAIAFEKAGIIKPGIPVVLSPQHPAALKVVTKIAAKRQAPLIRMGQDYQIKSLESSLSGQTFSLQALDNGEQITLEINLLGQHQIENASTAYMTLETLRHQGFPVSPTAIRTGFSQAEWPARFEVLHREPPLIIDSAHNPDSAQKMRETVAEYFPGKSIILIIGVSNDKDISGMLEALLPVTQQIICTKSTHPRAMDPEELKKMALPGGCPVRAIEDVDVALRTALDTAHGDEVILVTGSIFVAATARIAWQERIAPNLEP
jgi:dihydrofolate synthase / folylpolyglutamate synthase